MLIIKNEWKWISGKNNIIKDIDDLVDYNDFDNDNACDSKSQDSFNQDIIKLYEDHKKNNITKNENRSNHRPISSYLRNMQNEKKDNSIEDNINLNETIRRLNTYIKKNRISYNEFCDTPDVFLDYSTFKELFKKIRFDITSNELTNLFNYENKFNRDGYILMKNFFKIHEKYLEFINSKTTIDKIDTNYNIKKLNNEFRDLHRDILNIVNKESTLENIKKIKDLKSSIHRPITAFNSNKSIEKPIQLNNMNNSLHIPILKEEKKKVRLMSAKDRNQKEIKYMNEEIEKVYFIYIVEKEWIRRKN